MRTFSFVRPGEAAHNVLINGGSEAEGHALLDPALTAHGRAQAAAARNSWAREKAASPRSSVAASDSDEDDSLRRRPSILNLDDLAAHGDTTDDESDSDATTGDSVG